MTAGEQYGWLIFERDENLERLESERLISSRIPDPQ
jgi:hypothetical protein